MATLDNLGSLANGVGWSAERERGRWRTRLARQTKRMTSSTFVPLKSYFEFKVTLNHLLNQSARWQNIRAIVVLLGHLNGSTLSGNRAWWAPLRLLLLNPIPSLWLFRVLSLVYTTKDKTLNKHELTNYIGCNAASNVAVHWSHFINLMAFKTTSIPELLQCLPLRTEWVVFALVFKHL